MQIKTRKDYKETTQPTFIAIAHKNTSSEAFAYALEIRENTHKNAVVQKSKGQWLVMVRKSEADCVKQRMKDIKRQARGEL